MFKIGTCKKRMKSNRARTERKNKESQRKRKSSVLADVILQKPGPVGRGSMHRSEGQTKK